MYRMNTNYLYACILFSIQVQDDPDLPVFVKRSCTGVVGAVSGKVPLLAVIASDPSPPISGPSMPPVPEPPALATAAARAGLLNDNSNRLSSKSLMAILFCFTNLSLIVREVLGRTGGVTASNAPVSIFTTLY